MTRPKTGEVFTYPYRWLAEAREGTAIDGRKDRPCCVALRLDKPDGTAVIFLAPISSKPPRLGQAALEVPQIERQRAGLTRYDAAWIYVGELNRDDPDASWYLEPNSLIGAFSKAFLAKVVDAIRSAKNKVGVVSRTEWALAAFSATRQFVPHHRRAHPAERGQGQGAGGLCQAGL